MPTRHILDQPARGLAFGQAGGLGQARRDALDLKFWQKALREAEGELEAATTRTALDAAAKKFMRVKAELKRVQGQVSA